MDKTIVFLRPLLIELTHSLIHSLAYSFTHTGNDTPGIAPHLPGITLSASLTSRWEKHVQQDDIHICNLSHLNALNQHVNAPQKNIIIR